MARRWRAFVLVLTSIAVALAAMQAFAQEFVSVKGKEPIPREGFKSWSLFLVTNQDWLVPENAGRLRQLYDRSKAFGRVIGKEHAAVWFWQKDAALQSPALADNVDVERAVAYCKRLGRKPSDGPYLVFTTTYPDEQATPVDYQVIALQGKSADDISELLKVLGNQLATDGVVSGGVFQHAAGSDDFWSAWFDATRHAVASLKSAFCFAIRTRSFTIDAGCKPGGAS
jgi:hypothetical protein